MVKTFAKKAKNGRKPTLLKHCELKVPKSVHAAFPLQSKLLNQKQCEIHRSIYLAGDDRLIAQAHICPDRFV